METKREQDLNDITNSHINEHMKQMVEQVNRYTDRYGLYDVWEDLKDLNGSSQALAMIIVYNLIKYG